MIYLSVIIPFIGILSLVVVCLAMFMLLQRIWGTVSSSRAQRKRSRKHSRILDIATTIVQWTFRLHRRASVALNAARALLRRAQDLIVDALAILYSDILVFARRAQKSLRYRVEQLIMILKNALKSVQRILKRAVQFFVLWVHHGGIARVFRWTARWTLSLGFFVTLTAILALALPESIRAMITLPPIRWQQGGWMIIEEEELRLLLPVIIATLLLSLIAFNPGPATQWRRRSFSYWWVHAWIIVWNTAAVVAGYYIFRPWSVAGMIVVITTGLLSVGTSYLLLADSGQSNENLL